MKIVVIEPWAPHPSAAPLTERQEDGLAVAANGTRTCVGGWQVVYGGVEVGAYNEGDVPTIFADVDLGDGYRTWNGGCFRDVNWMQRRPHLYGAEIDIHCYGSLAELPS